MFYLFLFYFLYFIALCSRINQNVQFGHIYLDTGTIFIILAADQDLLKLQLYNEYGLKFTLLDLVSKTLLGYSHQNWRKCKGNTAL